MKRWISSSGQYVEIGEGRSLNRNFGWIGEEARARGLFEDRGTVGKG